MPFPRTREYNAAYGKLESNSWNKEMVMKSMFAVMMGSCVLLVAAALEPAWAQMPGGVSKASVKDEGVVQAAKFAVKAQQQAMKGEHKDEKLTLVKVLSAQQQVVQGMKYILTLQVKVGQTVKTAEAEVWVRLWLKDPEQYKLESWKFRGEKESKPVARQGTRQRRKRRRRRRIR